MKRFTLLVCLLVLVSSCDKKRIINRLEGKWVFFKRLEVDGTYSYHSDIYDFTGGKKGVKSDFPFVVYTSNDTAQMSYRVVKSNMIRVTEVESGYTRDWLVEDMDKKSLVVRVAEGVMFFEKN